MNLNKGRRVKKLCNLRTLIKIFTFRRIKRLSLILVNMLKKNIYIVNKISSILMCFMCMKWEIFLFDNIYLSILFYFGT